MKEIWKNVVGYEGIYSVSNSGHVRRDGKILKPRNISGGYHGVTLYKNGVNKQFRIHRLVTIAFIGVAQKDMEVNHKDGNKKNNNISNLEYVTNGNIFNPF